MSTTFIFTFTLFFSFFTRLARAQAASPTLHYPLQSQLPPVARVNQTFLWSLLPDTFLSDVPMSYAALDMPSWLSFDANSLTFTGQPSIDDLGNNYVVVQANATGNPVGTQSGFHCLVVDNAAPVVTADFLSQLQDGAAVYSSSYLEADGSVRIPPKWSFSVGFQWNTFSDPEGSPIFYTAVRRDTTSMPSWLVFDNTTVTFDGLAPSNTADFEIDLYGSEYYGYGDVVQTLKIVIGTHSFLQTTALPPINATAQEQVSYTVPISGIQLDGRQVSAANLSSIEVNIPSNLSYLSYNAESRIISGTVPSEIHDTNDIPIPVIFTSSFNDTIVSNITFHILAQLFASDNLGTYDVRGGKSFSYDLSKSLIATGSSYSASYSPADAKDWITFDANTKKISGTPPPSIPDVSNIAVNITGSDAATGVSESAIATLMYTAADATLQGGKKRGLSNGAKIALAVVFGVIGGLILLGLIMFLCRRYCHHEDNVDDDATIAASAYEKEKGKGRMTPTTPMTEVARTSLTSQDSDRLSQAIAAAEVSMANHRPFEQPEGPRRMGLFNVFGAIRKASSQNIAQHGSGRSIKELLGLTPSKRDVTAIEPRGHEIVVVTDGDGYTYRPTSDSGRDFDREQGIISGSENSQHTRSSWDSQQSSSLFYSEESNGQSPIRRPGFARVRDSTPRSDVPRRRQDFTPYRAVQQRSPTPPEVDVSQISMYPVGDASFSPQQNGGIRIVQTRDSSGSLREADEDEYHPSLVADAAITMATLENFNDHERHPSAGGSVRTQDSRPISRPRLIAFTSEKRGERSDSPPEQRFPSQKGIDAVPSPDNSRDLVENSLLSVEDGQHDDSTEDAEHDDNMQRYSTMSTPYAPPAEGETSSPIFFTRPLADKRASPLSNFPTNGTNRSFPSSLRSTRSRANSIIVEPLRIPLAAGEPFHFTAQINPPPSVSIGSPGRNGPVRSTYFAYTDYPDEPEYDGQVLPDWLHFDPRELEFWGTSTAIESGSIAVRVVERKVFPTPGSPSRRHQSTGSMDATHAASTVVGAASDETEQIVGRFVLEVTGKRSTVGSLGDVVAITY